MGPGSTVRTVESRTVFELRDLGGMADAKEVSDAIVRDFCIATSQIKVLNINKTYSEGQPAVIIAPPHNGQKRNLACLNEN